jgi:hypothetical protein
MAKEQQKEEEKMMNSFNEENNNKTPLNFKLIFLSFLIHFE